MMLRRTKAIILLIGFLILLTVLPIAQAEFGTNWSAQFWNSTDQEVGGDPIVATTIYPNGMSFNWTAQPTDGAGATLTAVNADNFSARFTSVQTFQQGTYQFVLAIDDGARVTIDGVILIDKFNPPAAGSTQIATRDMTAGAHTIIIDFVEFGGIATIQFQYFLQGVGGTPGVTPGVPTTSPVPSVTASVVSVRGLSLRTGPYLGATFIGVARPGTAYAVNGKNRDEGIFTWYLITVGSQTGWASGRYLQITGDPNSVPTVGSIFDTIDGAPDVGARAFPRAIMNFRRRPSIRAGIIGQIPWGAETVLIGRTVQGGRNFWLQVRYNGQVGWIFAPFITVHGILDAVPVR